MKIALATILALTSPAAMAGDYYYRPVGHTTTQSCYKKVMREEYIPPHRSHYGEGYINRYYDTEEVPCWTLGHRPYRPSYPNYGPQTNPEHTGPDLNSCEEGSFLGAILGGGAAAAMSEKDAMGWSIPLGVVSGALIGCQVDGG